MLMVQVLISTSWFVCRNHFTKLGRKSDRDCQRADDTDIRPNEAIQQLPITCGPRNRFDGNKIKENGNCIIRESVVFVCLVVFADFLVRVWGSLLFSELELIYAFLESAGDILREQVRHERSYKEVRLKMVYKTYQLF
jgi:hypothetical protein